MGSTSNIEWTDATWNPIRGCTRVSEGCRNCYAERMAVRLSGVGRPYRGLVRSTANGPRWTGKIKYAKDVLDAPLHWRKPRKVFVNSMGDLFHEDIPDEQIDSIFAVMAVADQHVYQVLTKRAERMRDYMAGVFGRYGDINEAARRVTRRRDIAVLPTQRHGMVPGGWPLKNVWLSISAEDQATADNRLPFLFETPAAVRGVSLEPLLGSINLRLQHRHQEGPGYKDARLHWCIVGGESGPGARPMHPEWPRSLRDQCQKAGVPFFFKQWGAWTPKLPDPDESCKFVLPDGRTQLEGAAFMDEVEDGAVSMVRVGKKNAGRELDDKVWDEYPLVTKD